jgi:hypothetical protein
MSLHWRFGSTKNARDSDASQISCACLGPLGSESTNKVVSTYLFDTQEANVSTKLLAATCIFSFWLENSSDCNKLYTCLGPLGSEATNKVVSACLFDTQGAKVRTKLIAATCILSWRLKNSIATNKL